MRVLLADDHMLMLEGLQNLLEAHGIEVAGTARDGREAAELARKLRRFMACILLESFLNPCGRCDHFDGGAAGGVAVS